MEQPTTTSETHTFPGVDEAAHLEPVGADRFSALTPHGTTRRLFGGLLVAQSVRAALATGSDGSAVQSVHTSFLRSGRPGRELLIDVDRIQNGRTFQRRLVTGRQGGEPVFTSLVSLQLDGHADDEPENRQDLPATDPDKLREHPSALHDSAVTANFDLRPATEPRRSSRPVLHPVWIRYRHPVSHVDVATAVVAFISDFGLAKSVRWDQPDPERLSTTSLDHALWIHRRPLGNPWLLLSSSPRWRAGERCLVDAELRSIDGRIVASISQEVLVRQIVADDDATPPSDDDPCTRPNDPSPNATTDKENR